VDGLKRWDPLVRRLWYMVTYALAHD